MIHEEGVGRRAFEQLPQAFADILGSVYAKHDGVAGRAKIRKGRRHRRAPLPERLRLLG